MSNDQNKGWGTPEYKRNHYLNSERRILYKKKREGVPMTDDEILKLEFYRSRRKLSAHEYYMKNREKIIDKARAKKRKKEKEDGKR